MPAPLLTKNLSRTLRRTGYFLSVVGLAIAFAMLRGQAVVGQTSPNYSAQELKAMVSECIPNNPPGIVKNVDLAASTQVEGREYFYFYAYDGPIPENPEPENPEEPNYQGYPSDLVISVGADGCQDEHFNPMNDPIPLATTLPQEVARQLVLNRYERVIAQIGRDGLQARINSWDTSGSLWDEERWALQQLEMQIPPGLLD